ncbi:autotransporter domain-containing protein [Bradyrhizobium genosp. A]|uniref:autotransporter domain-containing protein n=1 Tax=Bradyrhizobium genosp. A TaxID=83626 RepID=UPI003CF1000F
MSIRSVRYFSAIMPIALIGFWMAQSRLAVAEVQIGSTFNSEGPGPSLTGSSGSPANQAYAGAVQAIAADPSDSNVMYIGSVGGGIWKTTNGGTSWTALTDQNLSLSIGSLSLDPTDASHQTLIAGNGNVSNGGFASISVFSTPENFGGVQAGLLYSTNGGATFTRLGASTFSGQSVVDVAARGSTILAATAEPRTMAAGASFFSGGLYRSTNGGATFTAVGPGNGLPSGPVTSLVGDPNNPNTFYAAVTASSNATYAQTAVYRSTDGGATWSAVFNSANSGGLISGAGQTTIKLTAGAGGTVAVGLVNLGSGALAGLYYSSNSGTSWTTLTAPNVNPGGQAPVNIALAIDPTSTNIIYVSGDNNYSNNGGINALAIARVNASNNTSSAMSDDNGTPLNTSNGSTSHPDSRALVFDASGRLLVATDGGLSARTSPLTSTGSFIPLNNFSTMELYSAAFDGNSKRMVVSAQDNGSSYQSAPGGKTFNQIGSGDGINAWVNDVTLGTSSALYTTCQNLGCAKRTIVDSNGNITHSASISFGGLSFGNFSAPLVLNNIDPSRMALASSNVYVTQDTLSGAQAVTQSIITLTPTQVGATGQTANALDYGTRNNVNALLVGSGPFNAPNGKVWLSTTAGAGSLVQLSAYAGLAPTSVKFDTRSDSRFFVADSANLFGSTNQGASFQTLTVNLPANFIRPTALGFIDSNGVASLLVGGLNNADNAGNPLVTADSDSSGNLSGWRRFGAGLPNALITGLQYDAKSDTVAIATAGRGAWLLYDATSNYASASVLQFGLANNDSMPDISVLSGSRPLIKYGTGILAITGDATYTGGSTINGGTMLIGNGGTTGSVQGNVAFCSNAGDPLCDASTNKVLAFNRSNNLTVAGTISGPGQLVQQGGGTLILTANNTYTGGTTISSGILQLGNGGTSGSITGDVVNNSGFSFNRSDAVTFSGLISGTGLVQQAGPGTTTLSAANTYGGGTFVTGGTLTVSGAGTLGATTGATTVSTGGTLDLAGTTQTQAAVNLAGGLIKNGNLNAPISSIGGGLNGIGGSASLTTLGGVTSLFGINGYSGATNVNGGVLDVEGSITGTSSVTVNAGGALTGAGTVDPLLVSIASGGILAPGNGTPASSMTIVGNLAFQSGALYMIQLNPTTASFANVTGTATLAGNTVDAIFANGTYVSKKYTILMAGGGVSGTFSGPVNTNLPSGFKTSLSYDANTAYLDLALSFGFGLLGGLSGNQQAVGNALTGYFNSNGSIPIVYGALSAAALTQASGEHATGSQQATFDAMGMFAGILTDPFMQREGAPSPVPGHQSFAAADDEDALGYAARERRRLAAEREAYAMFTKAPLRSVYQPRWSVWAAGFGGSQSTDGNSAVGSNGATSRIFGTAVGADYLFSPTTLAGFALAGGGTNFSVSNLGSGRSDLFQAGAYVRHFNGPAYISAALAYGWQDITSDRTVTIAGTDRLRAEFNANAFSGRIEGGYRFVGPWSGGIGITPYAAAQVTTFALPGYAESVVSGAGTFALAYGSKTVTDSRSEIGLRTDKSFALPNAVLTLRGRFAWAHDFDPNRSVAATFQALPGASFVANGAAQASNSALTTASAEVKMLSGWTAVATFEGEFSNVTRSYAGKGAVRYAW